jgi:prolipoprotein diacylglyceryltransferase
MFGFYFIAVGVERFITEFWRTTPKIAFGWMSLAQMISIAMIITGLVVIEARKRGAGQTKMQPQKAKQII